jgi:hypothetical protein
MSAPACGKGWAHRCEHSRSRRCRCSCGGANHGKYHRTADQAEMQTDVVCAPRPLKIYANIEHYYDNVPAARRSGERDYGVWWKDEHGGNWRVSWVYATGDVYAIRLGRTTMIPLWAGGGIVSAGNGREGPVILLGRVADRDEMEDRVEGWAYRCGEPNSLHWIAARVAP